MDKPTDRQKDVLKYLAWHLKQFGYAPSVRVIADNFNWASPNAAQAHLNALARKGMIRKTPRGYLPL